MRGVSSAPTASIVIPTRCGARGYLDVALASVVPQAGRADAEVLVVSDGTDPAPPRRGQRTARALVSLPKARAASMPPATWAQRRPTAT